MNLEGQEVVREREPPGAPSGSRGGCMMLQKFPNPLRP